MDGDDPDGHLDINANMADNDNIGGDAHGFDNIDSSNSVSDGDDLDFRGGGGSREYNCASSEFHGGGGGGGDDFGVFDFCKGEDRPHAIAPIPPIDDEPKDAPQLKRLALLKICDKHNM